MKGWYRDNYRHSLARRGIRMSFSTKVKSQVQLLDDEISKKWNKKSKENMDMWRKRYPQDFNMPGVNELSPYEERGIKSKAENVNKKISEFLKKYPKDIAPEEFDEEIEITPDHPDYAKIKAQMDEMDKMYASAPKHKYIDADGKEQEFVMIDGNEGLANVTDIKLPDISEVPVQKQMGDIINIISSQSDPEHYIDVSDKDLIIRRMDEQREFNNLMRLMAEERAEKDYRDHEKFMRQMKEQYRQERIKREALEW